ncbi:hypothetical protein [Marinobacterium sediminicola]|uniref:DUF3149 domain-containing protein n=1 Tax=Marinobacterium sediminicola TaxID=518898 RepID=A0ABY1RXQ2_9GAMM|nr:hypothetical protein [Marinobacterium sediminicola]ULG70752.1 hypothetical protein LN244_08105 [Marinobacterium sediminicola]SMR71680.1 hypothetical protein SAMN04487964_102293 [Marinobacterium sediminicola]
MFDIDKYSMISFAPSILIVAAMLVISFFGLRFMKREIAKDAARAQQQK